MVARLVAVALWTLVAMAVQAVMIMLPGRAAEWFARVYWRGVAALLGVRVRVVGQQAAGRPVLFIANHCSWIDIVVLGAVLPACFISKAAVRNWPVINWVARLGRTIFVSRTRGSVGRERDELNRRLAAGDNIVLFPEGTTSDGTRVLPFAPSFLVLAEAPARPIVQPVTLVYDALDGLPVRRVHRPEISWYGDMALAPHFNRIGRRRRLHATLVFDPPLAAAAGSRNRKALARALEARLAANAAALRQGRVFSPPRQPYVLGVAEEMTMTESNKATGNDDAAADPGGARPKPANTGTAKQTVESGDRNDKPTEPETRIK